MTTKNSRGVNNNSRNGIGNGSVTVSQGTRSRLFQETYGCGVNNGVGSTFEPARSNGNAATLRLQPNRPDISATLNPKRISVATSTFWEGHPDMAQLVQHVGMENFRNRKEDMDQKRPKSSLWGTGQAMESSWGWGDPPALKKGILLQQKEHFLARWKERYCILTRDYLHCFRRTTSIHRSGVRLSEMGNFIFKLRLADIDEIQLEKRRIGTVISIVLPNEPKILLKVLGDDEDSTQQWFTLLQECLYTSKERRQALRTLHSSGTEAFRTTQTRHSLSDEGSPSTHSSSSNSDTERSPLEESLPPPENVVLRNPGKKTSLRDFINQETANRHSISIAENFEDDYNGGAGTRRSRRPESWTPQPPMIYNTPSLVPSASASAWLSQRRSIALYPPTHHHPIPNFSNTHLYSKSRHTSEITFRKMS